MDAPTRLALILSAAAITLPQPVIARQAALSKQWNGTFELNLRASNFGSPKMIPKDETRRYTVHGDRLTMRSSGAGVPGERTHWSYSARTNGKWYPIVGNKNADHIALTLVSDRQINSTTRLKGKDVGAATATLSADGKQITATRHIRSRTGTTTDSTLIYDRTK